MTEQETAEFVTDLRSTFSALEVATYPYRSVMACDLAA